MNVEDYFRKYSVMDGMGNMDGEFVPMSIAMLGVKQVLDGKMTYQGMSWHRPKYLYRADDKEPFVFKDGFYYLEKSLLEFPNNHHTGYTYELLISRGFRWMN
jgi:hypothetical protein